MTCWNAGRELCRQADGVAPVLSCRRTGSVTPGPVAWGDHPRQPGPLGLLCPAQVLPRSKMEVGRLLALGTHCPPTPMDILVHPWVAKEVSPVGTRVLLTYGVQVHGGLLASICCGRGSGPLPSPAINAINALLLMLHNFQLRWSRAPRSPHHQQMSQVRWEDPALVLACHRLRCVLSQVT